MSLNDGDVAALAERAAVLAPFPVRVQVEPVPDDDPYRWGQRYWLVHFADEKGHRATVRLDAGDGEQDAADRMEQTLRGLER
jgi:hypothetical protein